MSGIFKELPSVRPRRGASPSPVPSEPAEIAWIPAPAPPPRPKLPGPALRGLVGRFLETVGPHTEADPLGILLSFLLWFGVAVGRGPHMRVGGTRHGANLFVVLVGPTSAGRKGTAVSEARRLFNLAGEDCHVPTASGLSSGEGFVHAIRDPFESVRPIREKGRVVDHEKVLEDPGVSDKRLVVIETEFASALRRMERDGNVLGPCLRQAWDGETICTLTRKPLRATDPHAGVLANITEAELEELRTTNDSLNGFWNRFMFVRVHRPHVLPDGGSLRDEDLLPVACELREAIIAAREAGELERDSEAREAWARVYPILTADRPGLLGSVTARGAQHVLRLSLIYALLDREREIKAPHLRAALAVWEACQESAAAIFGDSLGDPIADDLLQELRGRADGMTRGEMVERYGRNVFGPRLQRALNLLASNGLAAGRKEKPAGRGRPAERWFATEHAAAARRVESEGAA